MIRAALILAIATAGVTVAVHKRPGAHPAASAPTPRAALLHASRAERRPPLRKRPDPQLHRTRPRVIRSGGHSDLNWRALAYCEATGNPRAVDPSGTYFGLYQFDLSTWRSVGGRGNPADASPSEQTYRAELLYAQRGRAPWPVCGRFL